MNATDTAMPAAADTPQTIDPHAVAPTRITRRGIWIGVGVIVFAIVFAFASIYARRTRLERTRQFFGAPWITAVQLADQVQLLPGPDADFEPVKLTATPGLGHLRRALLDERHYQWDTVTDGSVADISGDDAIHMTLQFSDPIGRRVDKTTIPMELSEGWIGTGDGRQRVRVKPRVQSALEFQLKMMKDVSQQTTDQRDP
ncbi:hypothetical protein [Crateriforma conspicua]|uniref:Uncharacterized protein n=1 Tax=Crateriforma conspicua TaxID=2527996 RepID=A0A5C5Y3F8_9PLAN|nr:hypothetical protein [Crateriforma conspicua]TWT69253.1 hypothetical protein Pan14r_15380 [Crateriforma conspicua]